MFCDDMMSLKVMVYNVYLDSGIAQNENLLPPDLSQSYKNIGDTVVFLYNEQRYNKLCITNSFFKNMACFVYQLL